MARRAANKQTRLCSHCVYIDGNCDIIGGPPGLGCRIWKGVKSSSEACKDFVQSGAAIATGVEKEIDKKTDATDAELTARYAGECLTTGSIMLDLLFRGGIPPRALYTIAGPEHSGKTTMTFGMLKDAISREIPTRVYDSEQAHDRRYIQSCGVNIGDACFKYKDFDTGESFYSWTSRILRTLERKTEGPPQMLFHVDSAEGMVPEYTDDEKGVRGVKAKMHSEGLQRIRGKIGRKRCILSFTNHIREIPAATYGRSEYMTGGRAIRMYSDIVVWIRPQVTKMPPPVIKSGEGGKRIEPSWRGIGKDKYVYSIVRVEKCRVAPAIGKNTWIRMCYSEASGDGIGVDPAYDTFQFLTLTGQAEWLGRERVSLKLAIPRYNEKKGLVITRCKEKEMSWDKFKCLVMTKGEDPKGPDLIDLTKQQLTCGWAYNSFVSILRKTESKNTQSNDSDDVE